MLYFTTLLISSAFFARCLPASTCSSRRPACGCPGCWWPPTSSTPGSVRSTCPLVYATVVDYLMAARMARSRRPKGVAGPEHRQQLACWASSSTRGFLAENINSALSLAGLAVRRSRSRASCCRRAMSFFLFQSISYTIDVYRGTVPAGEELPALRGLRVVLPASAGRPDRAGQAPPAPITDERAA